MSVDGWRGLAGVVEVVDGEGTASLFRRSEQLCMTSDTCCCVNG